MLTNNRLTVIEKGETHLKKVLKDKVKFNLKYLFRLHRNFS